MTERIVDALLIETDPRLSGFMTSFAQQGLKAAEWVHTGETSLSTEGQTYRGDAWRLQIDSFDHQTYAILSMSVYYGWIGHKDSDQYEHAKKYGADSRAEVQMTAFQGSLDKREQDRRKREWERERRQAAGEQEPPFAFIPYHYPDIGSLTWQFPLKQKEIKGYQGWFLKMAKQAILPVLNERNANGVPTMDRDKFHAAVNEFAQRSK